MKIDFFEQQRINNRKTLFLIFIFLVILGILGYLIDRFYLNLDFPYATALALGFGSFQSFIAYFFGDKLVLLSMKARPANENDLKEKQVLNIVREMSLASGMPAPKVYIIPEASPNAFATGRDPRHSSIGVTTGLIETMSREEIQGVIAHEMGHVRNKDILTMTIVSALLGAVVLLSDWARRILFYSGGKTSTKGKREGRGGGIHPIILIVFLVLAILAPLIARLMALAISRAREYMADAASAEFTRNPFALAKALEKIANHYDKVVDRATQGTAHLFISDPMNKAVNSKEGFFAEMWSTHPPIQKRIKILREMAGIYY
ncbi:MAG: M48 family metallopeptidase [Acidobacteriota bacterium]